MFEFAIRDDDPNYFTDPDELEQAYGALPDSIPISYALVPYHGCTKTPAIPREYWDGNEEFPIGDNEALVAYLNEGLDDGVLSVMQHGYNHVRYPDGPEFVAGDNLRGRVQSGRDYLEELFEVEIDVFVPPNNSFSRAGLDAIKAEGLKTCYYPTPRDRPISPEILNIVLRDIYFKYRNKEVGVIDFLREANRFWRQSDRSVFMPVRPWPYNIRGADEFNCVSMTRDTPVEQIKRQMEIADRYNGKFCLAIHYHDFRYQEFSDAFYEIIRSARNELQPNFVTLPSLFGKES